MNSADINKMFREKWQTLGSVESFTGGKFAADITSVGGASHFFKGALVTYATEEKNKLLNIPYSEIDKYGVVSKEIAMMMATRGKAILNTDFCVSFTGNAGPTAMEKKPVGEVHIGIAYLDRVQVYTYYLNGTRENIQNEAIDIAYDLLGKLFEEIF